MILASASPRRLELLQLLGVVPTHIIPADIDETPKPGELPAAYARRVTEEKARTVAAKHPGEIILAADTVVAMGRRILPKAEDGPTARRCLEALSGRRHHVLTAVAVVDTAGKLHKAFADTVVKFDRLSEADIAAYLASGEWNGKAGGYAIQGRAAAFVSFLSGSHSGVVGLPLHETAKLLTRAGLALY